MTDKKKIREMFKLALNSLLPFELFYKIIGVVIIVPVLIAIFNAAIRFSGYSYITQGNIIDFLKKPMTILILIIITLFFSFYVFIEIAAICISFNNAYYGKRITFKYLLYQTFIKVKKSLYYRNIPIFLVSLLFVPIIGIGFSSSFIGNLSIFKYIAYGIEVNPLVNALYITMMIIVIILSLLLMYTFQYYLINKEKVFTSMKKSIILFFKAFKISLIVFIKFIFIVILPIVVLFFGIAGILYMALVGSDILPSYVDFIFTVMIALSIILMFVLETISVISFFAFTSIMFFQFEENHIVPIHPEESRKRIFGTASKIQTVVFSFVGLIIIGQAIMFYLQIDEGSLDNVDGSTLVTAHRGLSNHALENSLNSVLLAIDEKIDFVEIDVQETKDGKIICMHDANLKKYTNSLITKNIWETNYDEIKDIDFHSCYKGKCYSEKPALLEDVIEASKGKIRINIELKDNGHSVALVKRVNDIIKEKNFINSCVITSTNISMLREMKTYDENYVVGYLVSIGLGSYFNETDMDFYSINYSFITKKIVDKLHKRGQEVHAWTVDSAEEVERLTELGVDNIITDDAVNVKKQVIIKRTKTSFIIGRIFDLLYI